MIALVVCGIVFVDPIHWVERRACVPAQIVTRVGRRRKGLVGQRPRSDLDWA